MSFADCNSALGQKRQTKNYCGNYSFKIANEKGVKMAREAQRRIDGTIIIFTFVWRNVYKEL